MATAAKPGATTKPGATEETKAPPAKKSKKMLIIIIAALLLLGGGATEYFLMKPAHAPTKDLADDAADDASKDSSKDAATEEKAIAPKYVTLGTFTANLIHEEGDRYLQVAITLKISKPDLEEKIKASNPEILHHVNMQLQSRRPSELATLEGKEKLASDIKAQIERVLGLTKPAAVNSPTQAESAPVANQPPQSKSGLEEVLFTSFIIQ
jgi:flagellar FliL protein